MSYKFKFNQGILKQLYEDATERMELHPNFATKYENIIQKHPYFKTEKEALEEVFTKEKPCTYQIWAKVEKDEEFYRLKDWWIATDNWKVLQAAEYIGMIQVYDKSDIEVIIQNKS